VPTDHLGIVAEFGERIMASIVSRFTAFSPLTPTDLEHLAKLAKGRRSLARGENISRQGEPSPGLFLVLRGWVASSATFANGATQLVNIYMTGDMVGTTDLALRRCAQSAVALTPVELSVISRQEVGLLFEHSPRLAALLFLISQEERVTLMDRLAAVGATRAPNSLASLLLHLHTRVMRSDPDPSGSFTMPLSQDQVAALIGVSPVHLNRTLQQLRQQGLVDWTRHRVTILNQPGLIAMSGLPKRELDLDAAWLPV
jgi:CRP-like cAMP-binding protein